MGGGYLYGLRPTMSTNRRKAFSGSKQNVKVGGERIISYPSVFENRDNCVLFMMIYEQKSLDLLTNGITGLFPTKTMLLTLITLS